MNIVIGVDPHKLSVTIEVLDDDEIPLPHAQVAEVRSFFAAWAAALR